MNLNSNAKSRAGSGLDGSPACSRPKQGDLQKAGGASRTAWQRDHEVGEQVAAAGPSSFYRPPGLVTKSKVNFQVTAARGPSCGVGGPSLALG